MGKLSAVFFLLAACALAQYTPPGKPMCSATVTTNCVPATDAGGALAIDTTLLGKGGAKFGNVTPIPMVSFTVDDNQGGMWKTLFDAKAIKGTAYWITVTPATPPVDWAAAQTLAAAGWEIGSHTRTHQHLPTLTTTQIEDELGGSYADLVAHGLTPSSLAYPFGETNQTVDFVSRKYYAAARRAGNVGCVNYAPYALDELCGWDGDGDTLVNLEAAVDAAIAGNGWLVIVLHGTTGSDAKATKIAALIDYIQAKPVTILPVGAAMVALGNRASTYYSVAGKQSVQQGPAFAEAPVDLVQWGMPNIAPVVGPAGNAYSNSYWTVRQGRVNYWNTDSTGVIRFRASGTNQTIPYGIDVLTLHEKQGQGRLGINAVDPIAPLDVNGNTEVADRSVLSAELTTNGTFATDTVWTKGTGWTISGGAAHSAGTASASLSEVCGIAVNRLYAVTFTVANRVSGGFKVFVGGYQDVGVVVQGNGTFTYYGIATDPSSSTQVYFTNTNGTIGPFIGDISGVSVKEVQGGDAHVRGAAQVGGLQFVTNGAKPTCTVVYSGKFWYTAPGTNTSGALEVCGADKSNSGTWAWKAIVASWP